MTLEQIETVEAHATSLLEWAKQQRAKVEKKPKKRSGLSEAQKAMLYRDIEKTFNRRKSKTQI